MRARLAALALAWGAQAAAETGEPLSPEAFLDLAERRTLTFARVSDGASFGVEQFLDRTRTRYRLSDGTCLAGRIEIRGPAVCFHYDEPGTTFCWWMFREDGRILALSTALGPGGLVEVVDVSDEPIACEAPPSV